MNTQESKPAPDSPAAFQCLLKRLVQVQGFEPPIDDQLRLELLGHILERYKHHLHFKPGRVNFEQFLQCSIFADEDKIVVAPPKAFGKAGTGIAPIQYQVPLLNFLLAHHKERIRVTFQISDPRH